MSWQDEVTMALTRRQFFGRNAAGIGSMALASLLNPEAFAATAGGTEINPKTGGLASLPHFAPKAKRVIYLHQSGGPSQIDLFDPKDYINKHHGQKIDSPLPPQVSVPFARRAIDRTSR